MSGKSPTKSEVAVPTIVVYWDIKQQQNKANKQVEPHGQGHTCLQHIQKLAVSGCDNVTSCMTLLHQVRSAASVVCV